MRRFAGRLRSLFSNRAMDSDFDQELQSHLTMLAEDFIRRGMPPEEALRKARLVVGQPTQLREAHRAVRGLPFLEALLQDLQYAVRGLQKSPGFAAIAVLTLAIGIGVNTAVFTLNAAVILRPPQAVDPERVLQLSNRSQFFSYPAYTYYRDASKTFSGLAAATAGYAFSLGGVDAPVSINGAGGIAAQAGFRLPWMLSSHSEQAGTRAVSGNFFQLLGINALIGRVLLPADETPGADPVVLLSENFWERRFGRDPGVLGRRLTLDSLSVTVVGVTPRDFTGTFPTVPDIWIPLTVQLSMVPKADVLHDHGSLCCRIYGRLAERVSTAQADAEMNGLAARYQLTFLGPDDLPASARRLRLTKASPLGADDSGGQQVVAAILLLAAIGLVLLIACANVASLLLARSAARQREIAVRLAIGASRGRLIRQLLTENAVLSLLAGVMGILFSWWTVKALFVQVVAFFPSIWGVLPVHTVPDGRVLAYTLFLALGATIAFGLAPALEASKPDLTSALKDEGAAFGGRLRKSGLRDLMVGTQVAICLLFLIAAGLLIRSSQRALEVGLGFDYRNIIALHISLPGASTDRLASAQKQLALADRFRNLPEIESVAATSRLPLAGGGKVVFASTNGPVVMDKNTPFTLYSLVTPNYFHTMRIPILRGRNFTDQETRDGENFDNSPVIVSEATAKLFWPGLDPLGKRFSFARNAVRFAGDEYPYSASSVVIGVAKDVRSSNIYQNDRTSIYLPATYAAGTLVLRLRSRECEALNAVERELQATPNEFDVRVDDSQTAFTNQPGFVISRVGAIVAAIVGVLGLLMASIGIYGTVGFAVTQRTQEIGVRMALGARRADVLGLILSQTMRPVAIGLAIGFVLTAIVARLMASFLVDVSSLDPIAFLGASVFLGAVALFAGYLPARRAAKIDPMMALRYE